jgi:group II intron reverse transcriptase/maturase
MESSEGKMTGMSSPETVSTKQRRIAELARKAKDMSFWSLSKDLDKEWLREAYRRTRKDGAVGVDGVTAKQYEESLEANLESLLDRAKGGRYMAPPVRRVYIPKGSNPQEKRPLGIPTLEDKILQRAVVMLLEPVYEEDFLDCSYGFRPKRSTHKALEAVWEQTMGMGGGTILEIDIRKFFDTVSHGQVQAFVRQRVQDGVITKLIGKWLNAGVLEDEQVSYAEAGTPQGGVISPLLANVYLHEVLDKWFEQEVKPRMKGRVFLVRYADDAVMGFANEADALRVMEVLPKRFEKYGLKLHPEKTKLVPFRPEGSREGRQEEKRKEPGTFDLLGFTHYWGKSRRGRWVVKRKTMKSRYTQALKRIYEWCRENRHLELKQQQEKLAQKLRGHYAYYGITGNSDAIRRFKEEVKRVWKRWLDRRSQRKKEGGWEWFHKMYERFPLPQAIAVKSVLRYAAKP